MKLLYIDLFCGAGGTSTGVENARFEGRQCAKVIGCVNHDANAIASHAANHPDALHFTEDIRTLELSPLTAHIAQMRRQHPDALIVLWASLECTNFSKAKGGQPRDADSRTLAEHLFRYIDDIDPDRVFYKYVPADIQALEDLGYGESLGKPGFWRNKQSMPARLARYFLRITARHGERLQEITEEAAKREGVRLHPSITNAYVHYSPSLHFTAEQLKDGAPYCRTARASFQTLMEMIEGPEIWEKNPFVWVYGFEIVPELTKAERWFYGLK